MKVYHIVDRDGMSGNLVRLDNGSFACPICGHEWYYPPIVPTSGDVDEIKELFRYTVGDICDDEHGCNVEFGVDLPYTFQAFKRARIRRLNELGWPRWLVDQIQNNLGINEQQLRQDAAELARESDTGQQP